ncbi:hypothetical protein [Pseudonocardia sp. D17]|uniref:hypothetical protein n=1 Tax=Pseudonocardia sp. D17 TaxID=882661 RepID=UPI002B3DD28D|nr:hypothetical protein PSD17_39500 [Pseudonocardia sp. D17]
MSAPSPAVMPSRRLVSVPAPPDPDPVPAMPPYRAADVEYDAQCSFGYWNHPCPHRGCSTPVPNHRTLCTRHED